MPPLLLKLIFARIAKQPAPFFIRPVLKGISRRVQAGLIDPQLALHIAYWENELGRHSWFAGNEFTAADVQMSFPVETAAARAGLDGRFPKLQSFLASIHARPAYQRALERGGSYVLAS